jgi:hypothetical protein
MARIMSLIDKAPVSVEEQYIVLRKHYPTSLFAQCLKENEAVYKISGGTGFTSWDYYFAADGQLIQKYYSTDNPARGAPGPLIDLSTFQCTILHLVR